MLRVLLAITLVGGVVPALAADAPLAIWNIPMGATLEQTIAGVRVKGYAPQLRPKYCDEGKYCEQRITIENLPGTDYPSEMYGWRQQAGKKESFRFYFTAPPNEARTWSAGIDQKYGDWYAPSDAAPLAQDVLAEVRSRFGPASFEKGDLRDTSNRGSSLEMWWMLDDKGNGFRYPDQSVSASRWPQNIRDSWASCSVAFSKAQVPDGAFFAGYRPPTLSSEPFLLARKGNCATIIQATLGQTRGKLYSLSIRIIDFKAGHDALVYTIKLVQQKRAASDDARSRNNRPDF